MLMTLVLRQHFFKVADTVKWRNVSWGAVEILLILLRWLFLTYSFTRFVNSDKSPIFVNWKKFKMNSLHNAFILTLASLNLTVSNLLNSELSFTWFTILDHTGWSQMSVGRSGRVRGCEPVLIRRIVSPSHISVVLISTSAPLIHLKLIFVIFEKIKDNQHSRDFESSKIRIFLKKWCDVHGYRTRDAKLHDMHAFT